MVRKAVRANSVADVPVRGSAGQVATIGLLYSVAPSAPNDNGLVLVRASERNAVLQQAHHQSDGLMRNLLACHRFNYNGEPPGYRALRFRVAAGAVHLLGRGSMG